MRFEIYKNYGVLGAEKKYSLICTVILQKD